MIFSEEEDENHTNNSHDEVRSCQRTIADEEYCMVRTSQLINGIAIACTVY
jgi:hypothetical protein